MYPYKENQLDGRAFSDYASAPGGQAWGLLGIPLGSQFTPHTAASSRVCRVLWVWVKGLSTRFMGFMWSRRALGLREERT